MKSLLPLLSLTLTLLTPMLHAGEGFRVYAPSRSSESLLIVEAKPSGGDLALTLAKQVDLGFAPVSITAHPTVPVLYVAAPAGDEGNTPGAVIFLDESGAYARHESVALQHGCAYLSTDRAGKFLLGVSYRSGHVDVYALDEDGTPGNAVAGLDEGRANAHCVLPSPDNRFVYIPYVKDTNALFQYAFDAETGALAAIEPKNANPPEGTGPRHMAYHPSLPYVYFSNEQGLGVSVYEKHLTSGQLVLHQVCDIIPADKRPESSCSASDIAITPDGKFLFTGLRSGSPDLANAIARYQIKADGQVEHLGTTPADDIPWGLTLSPDGRYLLVSAFKGATLTAFEIGDDGNLTNAGTLAWDAQISDLVTR